MDVLIVPLYVMCQDKIHVDTSLSLVEQLLAQCSGTQCVIYVNVIAELVSVCIQCPLLLNQKLDYCVIYCVTIIVIRSSVVAIGLIKALQQNMGSLKYSVKQNATMTFVQQDT